MGIAVEITRAWRHPRQAMQRQLLDGPREDKALFYVLLACILTLIAQIPRLRQEAIADPAVPFDARIGAAALGWLFLAPLALYAVAAASRVIAKVLGGQGSWYSARLALFWAMLVAAPLWMLNGVITGVFAGNMLVSVTSIAASLMFVIVWLASMSVAEKTGTA